MKDATTSPPGDRNTDDLIRSLSMQAGERRNAAGRRPPLSFQGAFPAGLALAACSALLVVILVIGPRPGLAGLLSTWTLQFKLVAMALLAIGAGLLVRNAAIPGAPEMPALALFPAALFMIAGVVFDRSGFPLSGAHRFSVLACMGAIVLAAMPALALMLTVMRRGIPTRPAWAGGMAGILAGSLGGLAYTIACINDGATFVALWYTLAIAIVAAIGAAVGTRVLAW